MHVWIKKGSTPKGRFALNIVIVAFKVQVIKSQPIQQVQKDWFQPCILIQF